MITQEHVSGNRFWWDAFKALVTRNVYGLKTNWKLDKGLKSLLLTSRKSVLGGAKTPALHSECFVQTAFCKPAGGPQIFPFAPRAADVSLPKDRLREIVEINQTLAKMIVSGQVVEACTWNLSEGLKEKACQCLLVDQERTSRCRPDLRSSSECHRKLL